MKNQLLAFLFLISMSAKAQIYRVTDNCASVKITDTTNHIDATYQKTDLIAKKKTGSVYLTNTSAVVVASWTSINVANIAPTLDSAYTLLKKYLGYSCVHIEGYHKDTTINNGTYWSTTGNRKQAGEDTSLVGMRFIGNLDSMPLILYNTAKSDFSVAIYGENVSTKDTAQKGVLVVGKGANNKSADIELAPILGRLKFSGINPSTHPLVFYARDSFGFVVEVSKDSLKGTKGATGATGAAGSNGTNGTNGATGATGATGAAGSNGTNGTNGATGSTGATGAAGSNGTNGTNGATGATGATGAAGSNGTNGTNGATGATGATGAAGSNGTNGTNGATGATGSLNAWGVTGNMIGSNNYFIGTLDFQQLRFKVNNTNWGQFDDSLLNIYIGEDAGKRNITKKHGAVNIGIGYNALFSDSGTVGYNTAIGESAGYSITNGQENLCLGAHAGYAITTGYQNTCVGNSSAQSTLKTGVRNVCIGYSADVSSNNSQYAISLGSGAIASSNQMVISSNIFRIKAAGLGVYATESAATSAGLVSGDWYYLDNGTTKVIAVVH